MASTPENNSKESLASFCKRLPKIELHAHLSGSISRQTLHEIWTTHLTTHPTTTLKDPLLVLEPPTAYNLKTFFPLFSSYLYTLLSTPTAVHTSTLAVLRDFEEDGVIYLELRTTPRGLPGGTPEEYVTTVLDSIEAHNGQMQTRLILSVDRRDSLTTAAATVELAVKLMHRGVVGVDLCGNPLQPVDTEGLKPIFKRAKEAGLGVTVHFAEAAATSSDKDLQGLLTLGPPNRLGHVIHVGETVKAEILEMAQREKVGIELCISCNVVAGMLKDGLGVEEHHFGEWWKAQMESAGDVEGKLGVKVVLCTDDVGVFMSSCSDEYRIVSEQFGLSRKGLWKLARGAVEVTFTGHAKRMELGMQMMEWAMREGLDKTE